MTGREDFSSAKKRLAEVQASEEASKSSCAQVASDHMVFVTAFAVELTAFVETTQVLQFEIAGAEGQAYSLFLSDTGLRTTTGLKGV